MLVLATSLLPPAVRAAIVLPWAWWLVGAGLSTLLGLRGTHASRWAAAGLAIWIGLHAARVPWGHQRQQAALIRTWADGIAARIDCAHPLVEDASAHGRLLATLVRHRHAGNSAASGRAHRRGMGQHARRSAAGGDQPEHARDAALGRPCVRSVGRRRGESYRSRPRWTASRYRDARGDLRRSRLPADAGPVAGAWQGGPPVSGCGVVSGACAGRHHGGPRRRARIGAGGRTAAGRAAGRPHRTHGCPVARGRPPRRRPVARQRLVARRSAGAGRRRPGPGVLQHTWRPPGVARGTPAQRPLRPIAGPLPVVGRPRRGSAALPRHRRGNPCRRHHAHDDGSTRADVAHTRPPRRDHHPTARREGPGAPTGPGGLDSRVATSHPVRCRPDVTQPGRPR